MSLSPDIAAEFATYNHGVKTARDAYREDPLAASRLGAKLSIAAQLALGMLTRDDATDMFDEVAAW